LLPRTGRPKRSALAVSGTNDHRVQFKDGSGCDTGDYSSYNDRWVQAPQGNWIWRRRMVAGADLLCDICANGGWVYNPDI
jgi:hypothetical protein